jgi:hypothetical protein
MYWFYDASRGATKRSGYLNTTWNSDGTNADLVNLSTDEYPEYGVGNSTDLTFLALEDSGEIVLRAFSVNNWTIKYKRLNIS